MKISWVSAPTVDGAAREANASIVKTLGLPLHEGSGRLAIVGGGNSIHDHIEELRAWDGGIWAVNGAINWCLDHGITAAFYTIDAQPLANWVYDLIRIRHAVLAADCDPGIFRALMAQGARVELLPIPDGGPTSAAAADVLSLQSGYRNITWFGCEGSFGETTHAFGSAHIAEWVGVEIAAKQFYTKPEFIAQAQIISEVIRSFPHVYSERSGGLLRAMVEHGPEHDVFMASNELFAKLKDREAA